MDLELGGKHLKEVAYELRLSTVDACVLLEIIEKTFDKISPDIELLVKLVDLTNTFLVCLAGASQFTEQGR